MANKRPSDVRKRASRLQMPVLWGMGIILLLLIYLVDRLVEQGVAIGAIYTVVIFFGWLFPGSRPTVVFGIIATVLIVSDYWISDTNQTDLSKVTANRIISIVVVWLVALLVIMAKNREKAISVLNLGLEEKVFERTEILQAQLDEIRRKNKVINESHSKLLDAIEQVRRVESKFQGILHGAPDAMIIVDSEGNIELVNQQVKNIFGYSEDALLGQKVEVLIPPKFRVNHPDHRQNFFGAPHTRPMGAGLELLGLKRNGEEFPVEISLSPLDTPDGPRVAATIRDITQRKKAEAIEIKSREDQARIKELEQFAYVASHDLQEPLRVVINFLQLLELEHGAELSDGAREYVGTAIKSSRRMKGLINGLLQYSRAGKGSSPFDVVQLKDLISEVQHILSDQISRNRAQIRLEDVDYPILGDEIQLLQLLQNVISNAIKFKRPDVDPEIVISANQQGEKIEIRIADNGIGIPEDLFETVFKIFGRLNQRDQYEGHGIGMSVASRIVDQHGGKILIDSVVGEGTTFIIHLMKASA